MMISIKKVLVFVFVFLEFASLASFANIPAVQPVPIPESYKELDIKITLHIEFGKRRLECQEFGICKLGLDISTDRMNSATGTGYIDAVNKSLLHLQINKSSGMTSECYKKYFNSGKFLIEDEYAIPPDVCKSLGLTTGKTIIPGTYSVIEKSGILYLSLPLR